jgi:FAD:protein FMN transferase
VLVSGFGPAGSEREAVGRVQKRMLGWHAQFSRFEPDSELSTLNSDDREIVPASPTMCRFVAAAREAPERTGGLVDPTLVGELERLGYRGSFAQAGGLPLSAALAIAPARQPARPRPDSRWRSVTVDVHAGSVTRPPDVRLDSGGIAKGLFGDVLAGVLGGHTSFAIDACGDLRFGGQGAVAREVRIASPFGDSIVHAFELAQGAAATSGIGRRAWLDEHARPVHHLLDPATGRPAYTGVVQATALAPTGVEAEIRAKAALLSGAEAATDWLIHGGVVVFDDGDAVVVPAAPALSGRSAATAVAA